MARSPQWAASPLFLPGLPRSRVFRFDLGNRSGGNYHLGLVGLDLVKAHLLHLISYALSSDLAVLLGKIEVDEMTAGPLGDCRHGAGATKRVEYNVPAITVKLDEAVYEFFGERCWMA